MFRTNDFSSYNSDILDHGLNVAVVHITAKVLPSGFDVSEIAPSSYDELVAHFESGKRLTVYSGGSDHTIFGDPEVNHHFRAWHDWCHYTGKHDFSMRGEYAVYEMQCGHLVALYGDGEQTRRWRSILFADGMGQKAFHEKHSAFPEDQLAFVKAFLAKPPLELLGILADAA